MYLSTSLQIPWLSVHFHPCSLNSYALRAANLLHFSVNHASCTDSLWFQPSHKMTIIVMVLIDGVTEVKCSAPRQRDLKGLPWYLNTADTTKTWDLSDSSHMVAKQAHAYLPRLPQVSMLLPHQGCLPTPCTVACEWTYCGLYASLCTSHTTLIVPLVWCHVTHTQVPYGG